MLKWREVLANIQFCYQNFHASVYHRHKTWFIYVGTYCKIYHSQIYMKYPLRRSFILIIMALTLCAHICHWINFVFGNQGRSLTNHSLLINSGEKYLKNLNYFLETFCTCLKLFCATQVVYLQNLTSKHNFWMPGYCWCYL